MTETVFHLDTWVGAAARLIAAQSYMIDRFDPGCEVIALPPRATGGGEVGLSLGPLSAEGPVRPGLLRKVQRRLYPLADVALPGLFLDLRAHAPGNWAHFLNNHLPFVVFVCRQLNLQPQDVTLILPETTPSYIRRVATLFGLTCQHTGARVTGTGVTFRLTGGPGQPSGWPVLRAARAGWARDPWLRDPLEAALAEPAKTALPARVFLVRRKTRALLNQAEIETVLHPLGFHTLYPEDLSVTDQFRLFNQAETIVAVHGAGLAPMLYRTPASRLLRLVEIMPVGHMTDVYRLMAGQLGIDWIGLRGRIRPEHVGPAYDLTKAFKAFSLQNFTLDPQSLRLALQMIEA